ncbi:MAG TPA: serine hydrolase domain-containing protein [Ktedonobacterales bacterium]|jgi:CubicO group peptidase (beta-lactamase class C family)|nr:serine hydrolase domain-containing protein [Ktedonobacterales bacterium]
MSDGGFSKARLGRMHDIMARHVERGSAPGLITAVSRRGEAHVDVLGKTAFGGSEPMRRDSIFRISSMSKPIAATAAMILVEECALRLDEPVDRLLPELANRQVLKRLDGPLDDTEPAHRSITLRDLLTFRMGFGIVMAPPDQYPIAGAVDALALGQGMPAPATPPDPDEWMRCLGTLPLMRQPGAQWMYNTGADTLGVLIARASGQPLETFLRERIFEPLGMQDTSFSVPAEKLDRLLVSYWTNPMTGKVEVYDTAAGGQWSAPPAFPSAAGGLVSTIDDYLAFGQMLLNRGAHGNTRLLSRPSVELMTHDHLTPAQKAVSGFVPGFWDTHGWGFCMSVVTRQDDLMGSVGSFGWTGGMGTAWTSDPSEDMVTILLTQQSWNSPAPPDVCLDCWTSAYQAIDD